MSNDKPPIKRAFLYYIQNRGFCGSSLLWWREGGHGYTSDLRQAWKVDKDKAKSLTRDRPTEDFAWPCQDIDRITELHVTADAFHKYRDDVEQKKK